MWTSGWCTGGAGCSGSRGGERQREQGRREANLIEMWWSGCRLRGQAPFWRGYGWTVIDLEDEVDGDERANMNPREISARAVAIWVSGEHGGIFGGDKRGWCSSFESTVAAFN